MKAPIKLLSPANWPAGLGLGLLWLITRLPYQLQFSIGRGLGKLIYHCAPKIRKLSATNIALCFPQLNPAEHLALLRKNFESLGLGIIETAMAWWMSDRRLEKCKFTLTGLEHMDAALAKGHGVILLGPHFFCLELIGRLLGSKYSFAVMYRPHKKALLAYVQSRFRKKYKIRQIARHRMRELLRTLEENIPVWYAYDVDAGEKRSVFAPFFKVQTASLTAVTRLVNLSQTSIVPIRFNRQEKGFAYEIHLEPALTDFPSGDLVLDATQLNATLETGIAAHPDQYIWQYKRFKTRPPDEKRFY